MSIVIRLELPDLHYRALSVLATRRGVNAHVLVEELIGRALANLLESSGLAESLSETDRFPETEQPLGLTEPSVSAPAPDWSTYGPLSPSGLPASRGKGGTPTPELAAARAAHVTACLRSGWPVSEIAHHLGMSNQGIRYIIRRHELTRDEGKAS